MFRGPCHAATIDDASVFFRDLSYVAILRKTLISWSPYSGLRGWEMNGRHLL